MKLYKNLNYIVEFCLGNKFFPEVMSRYSAQLKSFIYNKRGIEGKRYHRLVRAFKYRKIIIE